MSTAQLSSEEQFAATDYWLRGLFGFSHLVIRQKILSIASRYYVTDNSGQLRFYVVRPTKAFRYLLANLAAFIVSLCFLVFAVQFLMSQQILLALVLLFLGGNIAGFVRILLIPYRDIYVYTDESEQFIALSITQDNKFGIYHRYTIFDFTGQPVAVAKRPLFISVFRRRWELETLHGRPICRIIEDTLALSMIRRYIGPLFGMLRTNFDVELPNGYQVGEYNRSLTLYDQYELNVSGDPDYLIDRRALLAAAILLDTGEGR